MLKVQNLKKIKEYLKNNPDFEFLKSKKFRIKTMKLGNVYSQGIVFPMSILPKNKEYNILISFNPSNEAIKYEAINKTINDVTPNYLSIEILPTGLATSPENTLSFSSK